MSFSIILQFVMQTALIVVVVLIFLPIIATLVFGPLFSNTTAETQALRDSLWSWTIIIFIGAICGNVVWYYRALQRQEVNTFEF